MNTFSTVSTSFVGSNSYNTIDFLKSFQLVILKQKISNNLALNSSVSKYEVLIHHSAMKCYEDSQIIYNTNIDLVKKLKALYNVP